ncbi:MAG TPA: efflux RND transporter periplasmic adaptor subunit [Terriglobales bacterium]|nr:efflux RND transporter periplasmic adaptor subunit [Terriglobales bacterium]
MKPGKKFAILLAIILAVAVAYYFYSTDRNRSLVLIGTVDANQVIVSAKISGRIEKLLVDEGSEVKLGDLIAQLDTAEMLAQKRQAEAMYSSLRSRVAESRATEQATSGSTSSDVYNAQAKLESVQAQLVESQADLERQKLDTARMVSLADQGVASQQDRDRATASLKQAQARVDSLQHQISAARAELQAAKARTMQANAAIKTVDVNRAAAVSAQAQIAEMEARLNYTKVYSPVSGIVSVRAAREGEVVSPGTPIVTVVDLSDTWVRAAIPETYGTKVAIGETLPVRLPSGEEVTGKVIFKGVEGDFATQRDVSRRKRDIKTVALKLQIDNSQRKLVPGLTAEVLVPQQVLKRPVSAPFLPAQDRNGGSSHSAVAEKN